MGNQLDSVKILGVRVDKVNENQTLQIVEKWLEDGRKHYIVTPNVEFVILARKDGGFRKVLNEADLAIPDSARFGWAKLMLSEKNWLKRIFLFPFFLTPNFFNFPVTTGSSLIYLLCKHFSEGEQKKAVTIGLLGGKGGVAERASECLQKLYPGIKIVFADNGPEVDMEGNDDRKWKIEGSSLKIENRGLRGINLSSNLDHQKSTIKIPPCDIIFVAFGQGKQEKWIAQNLPHLPAKVAIGVGGAFDYISGEVPRAPLWMRSLGFEWLYRVVRQPWRIKRFGALVRFVFLILVS